MSLSQCCVFHRGSTPGREADIIAGDRHPTYGGKTLVSTTSLSPPMTNASCVSWRLETLKCRVREAWRFGTKTWSPWWRWRSMWNSADVPPSRQVRSRPRGLYRRRGIRVNCGLSTCTIAFARCHWRKDRPGSREPVTVPCVTAAAGGIVLPRVCGIHNSPAKQHGTAHPVTPDDGLQSTGATGARATQPWSYAHKCHRRLLISWA